ncbi:hypothetical protein NIES4074_63730 (plasmid) [Cylindrospermum sp. NIES-4074]|nr:hypothetical protein NIES4074_63730 [Cylindrospermum sp. NIES-4074]
MPILPNLYVSRSIRLRLISIPQSDKIVCAASNELAIAPPNSNS